MKITITIEPSTAREAADLLNLIDGIEPKRTVDKLLEANERQKAAKAEAEAEVEPEEPAEVEAEPVEEERPRRRRRTKAEMEAARAAEAAARAAEESDEDESDESDEDEDEDEDLVGGGDSFSQEQVIAKATELIDDGKTAVVRKALGEAGVRKVTELKPSQFAAFMKAIG